MVKGGETTTSHTMVRGRRTLKSGGGAMTTYTRTFKLGGSAKCKIDLEDGEYKTTCGRIVIVKRGYATIQGGASNEVREYTIIIEGGSTQTRFSRAGGSYTFKFGGSARCKIELPVGEYTTTCGRIVIVKGGYATIQGVSTKISKEYTIILEGSAAGYGRMSRAGGQYSTTVQNESSYANGRIDLPDGEYTTTCGRIVIVKDGYGEVQGESTKAFGEYTIVLDGSSSKRTVTSVYGRICLADGEYKTTCGRTITVKDGYVVFLSEFDSTITEYTIIIEESMAIYGMIRLEEGESETTSGQILIIQDGFATSHDGEAAEGLVQYTIVHQWSNSGQGHIELMDGEYMTTCGILIIVKDGSIVLQGESEEAKGEYTIILRGGSAYGQIALEGGQYTTHSKVITMQDGYAVAHETSKADGEYIIVRDGSTSLKDGEYQTSYGRTVTVRNGAIVVEGESEAEGKYSVVRDGYATVYGSSTIEHAKPSVSQERSTVQYGSTQARNTKTKVRTTTSQVKTSNGHGEFVMSNGRYTATNRSKTIKQNAQTMSHGRKIVAHGAEASTLTKHYYHKPTGNKSATMRSRKKRNFLKSPYASSSSKKGFSMGSRFNEKQIEEQPGPGMYESKSKAVEGPEYSIYGKYQTKYESLPGPGDYEHKEKTKSGWTMGGRMSDYKTDELPGPGAYDSQFQKEGVQWSMYSKRDVKYEQTPGPGDYELIKEQPKGVTIGQKQAPKQVEELPGPGMYTQKSYILEGPQYSMYQKRDSKIESTPGPGNLIGFSQGN